MSSEITNGTDVEARWGRVKQIFHQALTHPVPQRAEYLREACDGDPALRDEVERLLAQDSLAGDFLEEPAAGEAAQLIVRAEQRAVAGRVIGPYRLLREIGSGGMGTVYLAERADAEYRKQVAIKLVRPGRDNQSVVDRFRRERQILAGLSHPHIAQLLDGGATEEGLPYFVMDFIEGEPIDEYCDRRRLSIAERLELFRTVCSAVHYAHQNLIVHRDLKPSNILVTPDGTPKLLDFGIAKLLDPAQGSDLVENTASLPFMTFICASPEQVRGHPVTTASDVYSLAVLLYRLLAGRSPYRLKSRLPQEIERAVCEEDPERPSAAVARREEPSAIGGPDGLTPEEVSQRRASQPERLRRRLAGDLDNMLLMALRKEPQRRYASVEQFSEDIRRHLTGRPVMARKDTPGYRAAKFIRRHRAGVGAAALLLIVLLAGIVATRRQARLAERRFDDVRRLANALLFEVHGAIENLPGATPARALLVKRALEYLDRLAGEAGGDRSLQQELAAAYEKVGDIQGHPYSASLGDNPAALESYRKGLAIRQKLLGRSATEAEMQQGISTLALKVGDVLREMGDLAGALESYRQGLALRQQLLARAPADRAARRDLAGAYERLSDIQGNSFVTNLGRTAEALASQRRSLGILEALAAEDPGDRTARRQLAISLDKMAQVLWSAGDRAKTLESYRRALALRQELAAEDPQDVRVRRGLMASYHGIGDAQLWGGDPAAALESYRRGLEQNEALAAADPENVQARRDLAVGHCKMGDALQETGAPDRALEHYRTALKLCEALVAISPQNLQARRDLILGYQKAGEAQAKAGDLAEALKSHQRALALAAALATEFPQNAQARRDLLLTYDLTGQTLARMGSLSEALQAYQKEVTLAEAAVAADPGSGELRLDLALSCAKIGDTQAALAARAAPGQRAERWGQARSWFQRSLDLILDLRQQGALRGVDAGEPDRIRKEIARCDQALAASAR